MNTRQDPALNLNDASLFTYSPSPSRIALMVDDTVNLPDDILANANVRVLPINIILGERDVFRSDEQELMNALAKMLDQPAPKIAVRTRQFDADQITHYLVNEIALRFDALFVILPSPRFASVFNTFSDNYERMLNAMNLMRERHGEYQPFAMHVYDSQNFLAGQGVQLLSLLRYIENGFTTENLSQRAQLLSKHAYGLTVPATLRHLYKRPQRANGACISPMRYYSYVLLRRLPIIVSHQGDVVPVYSKNYLKACERAIHTVMHQIMRGLDEPNILVCLQGGEKKALTLPSFNSLLDLARQRGVNIYYAEPGASIKLKLGAGTFSIGMVAYAHQLAD